jgi:hypothetical protein
MLLQPWQLDVNTVIRPLALEDAGRVHDLIVRNRRHLNRWLRWSSGVQSEADAYAFITQLQTKLVLQLQLYARSSSTNP